MDPERQIIRINNAIELAKKTERKIKKKNGYLIKPISKTCELFIERNDLNKVFFKELSFFKIFNYPKDISLAMIKNLFSKKTQSKSNSSSFCRAGIMYLFLLNKVSEQNLLKYIRTNISCTNKEENVFKYNYSYIKLLKYLISQNSINVDLLEKEDIKIEIINSKLIDIKKALKENKDITYLKDKWKGSEYIEYPISLFILLKYKENYEEGLKELLTYKNENTLFSYGLLYGIIFY